MARTATDPDPGGTSEEAGRSTMAMERGGEPVRGRSVPVPTPRAAAVLVLAAAVPLVVRGERWSLVAVLFVAVVVVVTVDFGRAVNPARLGVRRELPATVTVGDSAQMAWIVDNPTERHVVVSVADAMWPSLGASRRSVEIAMAARRRHRVTATLNPRRRGRFPFSAVTVQTTGPLGLVRRRHTRDVPGSLAVLPAYPSRELIARRMRVPLESGLRSVRQRGTGTDFDQLREYRPGDDIRRLDWAATARSQRAIVREYRAERNQHVVALLDNGRVMAGTVGDAPRVEHAMDAVLGLSQLALHVGDDPGLVTFDQQVRAVVPASSRVAQFSRVAEAMYLLDTSYAESAYRVAFTVAASRFRRRSLFVVFTDLVESVVSDALAPALATLTHRHLVMVASVRDPMVESWVAGRTGPGEPLGSTAAAYRSAAAIASLDARDRAAARLAAAGVIVVDAQPGRLATSVADRYLELKASGRL